MIVERVFAFPNKNTFQIEPIRKLIYEELVDGIVIDPFANEAKIASITNDLDPQYDTDYNLDALEFLKLFDEESVDMVLFDPPYSPRQVSEHYKRLGYTVNMETTQASYWSKLENEIARIVKPGGKVITCRWNSKGIGKRRGFKIKRVLLVNHGDYRNDTLVVVDTKVQSRLTFRSSLRKASNENVK